MGWTVSRRIMHACIDVRGVLGWPKRMLRGMFRRGGKALTPDQAKDYLLDELSHGHLVLPMSDPPCEGFSYTDGCPGHPHQEGQATR